MSEKKRILCFGDSNTYGLIPGTGERYDSNTRWTGIVGNHLHEKGYQIIEEGLCGRTTVFDDPLRFGRRGSQILPILLESHNPLDLVVVMLGTNDCKTFYNATAGSIASGARYLIRQIRSGQPRAEILLISPIHLGEDVWDGFDPEFNRTSVEVSKGLADAYGQVAREEQVFYLAASDYAAPSATDREHMDSQGHAALAETIEKKILQILG
ncbi:MAG: SGNH/GDSL hydrolase family protein [Roseburia sp.]